MDLSIVIPAYNEAHRLPKSLPQVAEFARKFGAAEVIVVDNGSTDDTGDIAVSLLEHLGIAFQVIHEARRGKGRAVRRGMLEATGQYRLMADADLATPPSAWNFLIGPIQRGEADVVIGSRRAQGAVVRQPVSRRLMGRIWIVLVHSMFPELRHLRDTQCGFKAFTARATEAIFPLIQTDGMAFDVELLLLANRMGYRIMEAGVPWSHDGQTRLNIWDPLIMYSELERIQSFYAGREKGQITVSH